MTPSFLNINCRWINYSVPVICGADCVANKLLSIDFTRSFNIDKARVLLSGLTLAAVFAAVTEGIYDDTDEGSSSVETSSSSEEGSSFNAITEASADSGAASFVASFFASFSAFSAFFASFFALSFALFPSTTTLFAKTKLNDLINSYGPKILNGAEKNKLAAAKKLVETSLTKYETKQKNDSNENAATAAAKIKDNIAKNDPVKVCNMISGLLTSMKTKLDGIHLFKSQSGGKKTHTRKHNKFKKNKTRRKRLMSSKRTIKNKHRRKMTRIYRKSNN